jgi:hypothetical protein|tara:strand:- start:196 stop:369 length:174 start_codon:yes stop_codon:yes gene_type:complete
MIRPDPMIPCKPGAQDVEANWNRQLWLDQLYVLDGRDNPDHEMHGLYTGLALKYQNQ